LRVYNNNPHLFFCVKQFANLSTSRHLDTDYLHYGSADQVDIKKELKVRTTKYLNYRLVKNAMLMAGLSAAAQQAAR